MELPKEFKKCPVCGSEKRVSQEGFDKEEVNKLPNRITHMKSEGIILPTSILSTTAPAIVMDFDVCSECGCFYAVKVSKQHIPVSMPQGNQPQGFGRG